MWVIGGPCDGQDLRIREWPPHPLYMVLDPFPSITDWMAPEVADQKVQAHEYRSVELRWPSGGTRAWVLVPAGLTDSQITDLLLERGLIDG